MEINLNNRDSEFHNIYDGPSGLQVRDGIQAELRISDVGVATPRSSAGTETKFVFGFSAESANSGEIFHYIFTTNSSNVLSASLYSSQFICKAYYTIGQMTADLEPFSYAINYNQIVVNSKSLPYPLWGFIGGTLTRANKVESINPDTPALTLFPGRVTSFADRFAWAYANQVIFNDPGTEPRTICAPNAISLGGTVLDMFQSGEGGNLIIACTDGTYVVPPDALNGFQFQGVISKIPGYQAARSNNIAVSRGNTLGLTVDGVMDLASFQKLQLAKPILRRALSSSVGPGPSGDYRSGSIFGTNEGYIVTIDGKSAMLDLETGKVTWLYIPGLAPGTYDIDIVATLKDQDGVNLYMTSSTIFEFIGNWDWRETPTAAAPNPTATIPLGSVCLRIPSDPQLSPVVREITTSANFPNRIQYSFVRGSLQSATTPQPAVASNQISVIGTSFWGASNQLCEREMRSRRMQRAIRIDSPDVELSFTGGQTNIGDTFDLITKGVGRLRARN
jgi:hypothetical protein